MKIKKSKPVYFLFLFSSVMIFFSICMCRTSATAQVGDIERTITASTYNGDITLRLFIYDITDDPDTPLNSIETQTYIKFEDCTALGLGDPNLSPLPWGDFPYGLWRAQITLTNEFDPNIHRIIMKISFPGQIDPLNAEYWAQEYNNDKQKVEWKDFSQDLFLPNVGERSIEIRLSDSKPSELPPWDIESGYGDRNITKNEIDHVGGLLWPIEVGGRCFIDHLLLKKPH